MDDKELGRMLRLEKVEENTFPEEKTKEVLQKEKHDQLKFRLKKRIRPEVFARMPEEIQDFLIDMDPTDMKEVYISTLLNLPWESEFKVPKIELMEAKTMLDSSHYAMLEVKEKVLRYMACQKYLGKNYGAVMLLAGPPGVGKTSIAVSIAKAMGRPQGTYITIEAPDLSEPDEDYHREISEEISVYLKQLIDLKKEKSILVVGLGNAGITADALGPHVVENLRMTRHIIREYGLRGITHEKMHRVSGIVPGVMAQTGMETAEIIQGVVAETKPDVVIAIDALAARSVRRLNRTIQITDTGIHPGSGVGNHRNGLTEENLQVKVIGIGVPTVVDAATIVLDSMAHLLDALEEAEQKEFLEEMIAPNLYSMFVTPKDVDETVKYLSFTISEGLNTAFGEA